MAGVLGLALGLQAATGCGTADQFTGGDPFMGVGGEGGEVNASSAGSDSSSAGTNAAAGVADAAGPHAERRLVVSRRATVVVRWAEESQVPATPDGSLCLEGGFDLRRERLSRHE